MPYLSQNDQNFRDGEHFGCTTINDEESWRWNNTNGRWPSWRYLAGGDDDGGGRMDYSVLSVGVFTLGLIMVVEVIRHRLDHMAIGKPYITAVLENIYAELTTLGIVEFFLFILQEYHPDLNYEKKEVFGDVHFALFYTALFNAFQSMVLAFFTTRVSKRIWVQTEALELNHYVELREEFDRVRQLVDKRRNRRKSNVNGSGSNKDQADRAEISSTSSGPNSDGNHKSTNSRFSLQSEYVFDASYQGVRCMWHGLVDLIRYPRLMQQYNSLLLQVRFHELRVHFLKSYDLPPKLRVSDYLLRCELHVLIKLVHVSSVAWLLLTASMNLLYFILGIVGYKQQDPEVVGVALIYIFFCSLLLFLGLTIVVWSKMKRIFREIMHREELWQPTSEGDKKTEEEESLAKVQTSLFWGGSPKIVIAALQFMQFGYALFLSVVIIFWNTIADGGVGMEWYLFGIIICYSLFVAVASNVIPRYTLCTSLAQLVDRRRLNETVANYHLEEAKRQKAHEMYMHAYNEDHKVEPTTVPTPPKTDSTAGTAPTVIAVPTSASREASQPDSPGAISKAVENVNVADLVGVTTGSLRNLVTSDENSVSSGKRKRRERRRRHKAISDGVAMMASMREEDEKSPATVAAERTQWQQPDKTSSTADVLQPLDTALQDRIQERRRMRRANRKKSVSDGVAVMAAMTAEDFGPPFSGGHSFRSAEGSSDHDSQRIADLVNVNTASLRAQLSEDERRRLERSQSTRTMSRRQLRAKSKSDPDQMAKLVKGEDKGPAEDRNTFLAENHEPTQMVKHAASFAGDSAPTSEDISARRNRRRMKTVSDGVQFMADATIAFFNPKTEASEAASHALSDEIDATDLQPAVQNDDQDQGDASIWSRASNEEDDNFSDIDDIPIIDATRLTEMRRSSVQQHRKSTFKVRCTAYFTSKNYVVMSNVFGTMVAFFLVGSRVERFLHTEDIVPRDFISFDFSELVTFWMLSAWMIMFLATDLLVLYSVDRFAIGRKFRTVWLSAIIDVAIVSLCLVVFWVAESQRCCEESESSDHRLNRRLAGDDGFGDKYANYGPAPCDCPIFGSRLYGGLGKVEPFTSLICLRLFRFMVAKRVTVNADKKRGIRPCKEDKDNEKKEEINLDPFAVVEHTQQREKHVHGHEEEHLRGTAAELWESAIAKHPEIAERFGLFSVEILHAMLGLPVSLQTEDNTEALQVEGEAPFTAPGAQEFTESSNTVPASRRASYKLESRYSSLSVHTQEIIMQGKLGKRVRSVGNLQELAGAIPEEETPNNRGSSYVFEIDDDVSVAPTHNLDQLTPFDAPEARLVRSMRRADRKLLPILPKWTVVDVVMTRFEMVYFDATDSHRDSVADATLQAVKATKGGKGLRLKDVAVGRKVVGHLLLTDIHSLAIERYMPHDEVDDGDEGPEDVVAETEYWKDDVLHFTRSDAWKQNIQDTLAIHTTHQSTLYLRFYSDLEESELHPERLEAVKEEGEPQPFKNNASQWVQTLGRFCGPDQLQQSLPHFGKDADEELRDYMIVHGGTEHRKHRMFMAVHAATLKHNETVGAIAKRTSRRFGSMAYMRGSSFGEALVGMAAVEEENEEENEPSVRSIKSAGENGKPASRKSFFHRSQSNLEDHSGYLVGGVSKGNKELKSDDGHIIPV